MKIIEISALSNGAHRNRASSAILSVPEGWARVPDEMDTPNFPFGSVTVEDIGGVPTVTNWTAGVIPEPEEPEEEKIPTNEELAKENKELKSKLEAAIESNSMLEECIAEMAEVVYA